MGGHIQPAGVTQPRQGYCRAPLPPATSVFITTTKREGLKSARSKPCPVSGFRSATRNANSKTFPSDTTLSQPTQHHKPQLNYHNQLQIYHTYMYFMLCIWHFM